MQEIITSDKNSKIKFLKKLYKKKYRKKQGKYILEGYRIIVEALRAGADFDSLYFSPDFYNSDSGNQILDLLKNSQFYNKKIKPIVIDEKLMVNITDTDTPQGIIAAVNENNYKTEDIFDKSDVILLIDRIQDPGNMGTIIRTAVAAGVEGLIILKGSVDIYNLKVLRATMGAIFNIKFIKDVSLSNFFSLYRVYNDRYRLIAADLSADTYYDRMNYGNRVILAAGNEGNGLCREILEAADKRVKIPIIGDIESINVAVATGIILYDILRKRN
ncbi:MAG: TrmH family RNA methyltransferase [Halanaerobiales bacterium]